MSKNNYKIDFFISRTQFLIKSTVLDIFIYQEFDFFLYQKIIFDIKKYILQ